MKYLWLFRRGTIKTNVASFPAIQIRCFGTYFKFADWPWQRVNNWTDATFE